MFLLLKKERKMKKIKVYFTGHKTYIVNNEDEAIKAAENDLIKVHGSLNLDIGGVKENAS